MLDSVPSQLNAEAAERLSAGEDLALDRRESRFQGIRLRLGPLANVVQLPHPVAQPHRPSAVAIRVADFL